MPEGEEDISWSWIKESLPPLDLGKQVLHRLQLIFLSPLLHSSLLRSTQVFQLSMTLATHSLCTLSSLNTFAEELPEVQKISPSPVSHSSSSPILLPFVPYPLPGAWYAPGGPGGHIQASPGPGRPVRLPQPAEYCLQYRYLRLIFELDSSKDR